jgi:hypothetical protein
MGVIQFFCQAQIKYYKRCQDVENSFHIFSPPLGKYTGGFKVMQGIHSNAKEIIHQQKRKRDSDYDKTHLYNVVINTQWKVSLSPG